MNKRFSFFPVFVILLIATCSTSLSAQKFGHLNTGNLLELLPEVAEKDSLLMLYRDSLVAEGQKKANAFQEKVNDFFSRRNAGEMTPKQEQEIGASLQQEEESLAKLEQEIMNMVGEKRNQFLGPILGQVNEAIQQVAKEKGYTMIFDTSVANTVLFAKESDDIMGLVLEKLGVRLNEE